MMAISSRNRDFRDEREIEIILSIAPSGHDKIYGINYVI